MSPARWPRLVGVAAFVAALFLYRSHQNRPVLGLWSYAYVGVLIAGVVLLVGVGISTWRSARAPGTTSKAARLWDAAILAWGAAYLWSALDDPADAARVVDADLFGSVAPASALGEWLALCLGAAGTTVWLASRLNETGRKLLLSVAAFGAVALLGEGALRIRAAIAPETQGFPTATSAQWKRRYVSLNQEGFRDVEHPRMRPTGQKRLLVVGDSFAFGAGVNEIGDRVGEQLATELSARLGEPWQSMNAALGDSDTLDELGYLEQLRDYERDAVLLVYVFNDIDYLAPVTERTVLTEHQGGLVGHLHPARLAFRNSYLFQELFVRARLARYALSDEPTRSELAYADDALLARHLGDLERFATQASQGDVPVWIAPFDLSAGDGGRFAARYDRFFSAARARELPVVSLARAFDGEERVALRVNRLDSHPNARAHRLAAEALAAPLAAELRRGLGRARPATRDGASRRHEARDRDAALSS